VTAFECEKCFHEEGSLKCVRPSHQKDIVLGGSDRDEVLDSAYQKLKSAVEIKETFIGDRLGGYTDYSIKWNKKHVVAVLNALLETLA
jgi:hypothetical protein